MLQNALLNGFISLIPQPINNLYVERVVVYFTNSNSYTLTNLAIFTFRTLERYLIILDRNGFIFSKDSISPPLDIGRQRTKICGIDANILNSKARVLNCCPE